MARFAGDTLKGQRDRAILATLLYHGVRREELCRLRVRDLQQREGVLHFRVHGKGDKVRYIPVGLKAQRLITEYLDQVHGKICTRHYNICTEQTYGRL